MLTDAQKRAAYDQYGHAGVEAASRGGRPRVRSRRMPSAIFSAMCSATSSAAARRGGAVAGVPRRRSALRARDRSRIRRCSGTTVEIEVAELAECETCGAAARPRQQSRSTCDTCDGAGQVRISQGFFQLQQTCPRCRGAGTIVKNPCDTCLGQGRVRRTQDAVRQSAGGRGYRRPHPLGGEGEAGSQWRAAGRSVRRSPCSRARDLRARRRAPAAARCR